MWQFGLPSPWWMIAFVLAAFGRNVCAQDPNFYYTPPQARFLPSNHQQHEYINPPNHQTIQQTSPGFQQLESYFPTHRDLQTSDLPLHLQQTLPQYRFSSTNLPKGSLQHHFPHPAPFRPSSVVDTPSTHRPNYSHLFSKNHHDDTETFLGQITIESPAELPPLEFIDKPFGNKNLDERNTVSLGFLNHRTRIFAPTSSNQEFKNKPHVKDYFVSVNGDVYATGRSTTPYPITTLIRKDRYNPLLYKPTMETPAGRHHTFDLESLLEEPIDQSAKRDEQNDRVEVIKSVTVPPDEFYTFAASLSANDKSNNASDKEVDSYEYDEDVTDQLINDLELHENENNVSDIVDNSLIKAKDDKGYDVLTMKPSAMVKDDNFKEFVDSTVIDSDDTTTQLEPKISVVTTKSVINNTVTPSPKPIQQLTSPPVVEDDSSESWIVVASVQTSRSVSGARYLPSPIVEQEERTRLPLNEPSVTEEPPNAKTKTSTESLIDKLDRVQSDLSIGLLSDGFKPSSNGNNIALLQEKGETTILDMEMTTASFPTTTTRVIGAPVVIKKFIANARPTFKPTFQTRPPKASASDPQEVDEPPIRVNNETLRKPVLPSDVRKFLPIGYTRPPDLLETQPKTIADILLVSKAKTTAKPLQSVDPLEEEITTVEAFVVAKKDDISAVLPPQMTTEVSNVHNKSGEVQQLDLFKVDAFLPPGYKKTFVNSSIVLPSMNKPNTKVDTLLEPVDNSKFLPSGYKKATKVANSSTVPPSISKPTTNKVDTLLESVDISKFLPPGYKKATKVANSSTVLPSMSKPTTKLDTLFSDADAVDISKFLPPGYKKTIANSSTVLPSISKPTNKVDTLFSGGEAVDISKFLPPGYKKATNSSTVLPSISKPTTNKVDTLLESVDITKFLPPGYKKSNSSTVLPSISKPITKLDTLLDPDGYKKANSSTDLPSISKPTTKLDTLLDPVDITKFLPPGYKPRSTTTRKPSVKEEVALNTSTEVPFKVVFPSRRGGGVRKSRLTTPKYSEQTDKMVPSITAPTIHKGWPSRATTEFTGWPTPSTTPISIERLLERARSAAAAAAVSSSTFSVFTTTSSSTTSTTSTTTQRPTTPGLCRGECDLAGTIKLIGGAKWVPELLDRNTKEWQILANEVQSQLEDVYSKSSVLNKWYKRIRIDGFSEGSVLVDYLVELNELGGQVDTLTIRRLFHDSLVESAGPAAPSNREPKASDLIEDEQTDTVLSEGTESSTMVERPRFGLGNFIVDPTFTDFIVIPKQLQPTIGYADENVLLPQWAIAVIVIGLASLLFVIIFGVTVLVNRQKSAKKKQPTPLTEDMLHELNKNHMSGIDNYGADDDLYNMEDVWNDRNPYEAKMTKKRSTGSIHADNSMANLYDSWKSEWNGYYYNAHYGNPHQQPGASSTNSGPAYGHHQYNGRRRSDYDTNF